MSFTMNIKPIPGRAFQGKVILPKKIVASEGLLLQEKIPPAYFG
jgi:hypothetical protein